MREFIDVTGKSEEEAIRRGLAQLGLERDDVSVEILERAKSGFLGLGSSPAKVRLTYGPEEETPASAQKEQPKAVPAPVKPVQAPVSNEAPKATPAPIRQAAAPTADAPAVPAAAVTPVDNGPEVDDEKSQAIQAFLSGLLNQMESPAQIHVYQPEKGRYKVILEGDNLGSLIGRRGETLDAIQQLTSYCVNRAGGSRVRIQVDAEDYREKREQSLQHLAQKVAGKVLKYRRSVTLEPMNAYERHVIHTALQDMPGVSTYSTGTEPNRRVIVSCDRDKK